MLRAVLTVLTAVLLTVSAGVFCAPRADALIRGMFDDRWVGDEPAQQESLLREYADRLHVQAVRIFVRWNRAEPERVRYNTVFLNQLDTAVAAARRHGLRVMLAVYQTPRWASDQRFWKSPPPQVAPGYQHFYAMRRDALNDFRSFASMLATRYKGRVTWYECWNEPNLAGYLYPQQYAGDRNFAARTYVRYLRAFHAGIKSGDRRAKVLGGVTSPHGNNDRWSTSPKRFANRMKYHKAWRYWDGYSHHPYPIGGVPPAPGKPPRFSRLTISLGNARWLLRKFPRTQFYFTEYGYTTGNVTVFGGSRVSPAQQARYLTEAYRLAARMPRVRMLMWLQWKDLKPPPGQPAGSGNYFGLRCVNGKRKPSWFSFRNLVRQR